MGPFKEWSEGATLCILLVLRLWWPPGEPDLGFGFWVLGFGVWGLRIWDLEIGIRVNVWGLEI